MYQLHDLIAGTTPYDVMKLKNELQRAMANYSKGKQGSFDSVQEKSLAMMVKIEKWLKSSFIEKQMKILRRNFPNQTESGLKGQARVAWENYNTKWSY